ncbi:MAG: DUF4124 domain-containing protein [Gallionella sp.]
MKLRFLSMALLAMPLVVQASIYKVVDDEGHVTYSSAPAKGAKRLDLPPLPAAAAPARTKPTRTKKASEGFPRVDKKTQKKRDDIRRRILEDELEAEKILLVKARRDHSEASPEVYKGADDRMYRNVGKFEKKTKALNEQIEQHEKNIAALNTELSKLK